MSDDLLLGIDVGTSAVKAAVCDPAGTVVARGRCAYLTAHPAPGRSEQDPDDWWRATVRAVREAIAQLGSPDAVSALALTTQGGTLAPIDEAGLPTHPAIVWADARCDVERDIVAGTLGDEWVYDTTGWMLGSGLNLLETLWLRRHEPDAFRATRWFLSVPDLLARRLTGRAALDISNAGINQFADFRAGTWDERLMDVAGVDAGQLGEILPAGSVIDGLRPPAAEALGLRPGIPVVNGGHDQYCVALGAGVTRPGDTFVGCGTAWVVAVIGDAPQPDFADGHCVSRHVVDGRFGALASLESGGASLEWWRDAMTTRGGRLSWDDVDAGFVVDPQALPLYLPFLHGSRFPRSVPQAGGVLWGLDAGHDRFDIASGVMAGVCFHTAWMLDSFADRNDQPVVFSGGATRSRVWPQLFADVLGVPIRVVAEPDAGAVGAALLAGAGTGVVDVNAAAVFRDSALVSPSAAAPRWREAARHYRNVATDLLRLDPGRVWNRP